jgi:predicted O-methyltransferase YrrM
VGRVHRYRTALSRHHRSRGFGIHSPFAFNFVLNVLGERAPYYEYDYIRETRDTVISLAGMHHPRHPRIISEKNAKMLFRIVNYFNPEHIFQIGTSYGVSTASMMSVSSQSRLWLYEPSIDRFPLVAQILKPFIDDIECYYDFKTASQDYDSNLDNNMKPFILINAIPQPATYDEVQGYLFKILESDGVVIMRNISRDKAMQRLWLSCRDHATYGMTFSNEKISIIVANPKLPRQDFLLWF